MFSISSHECFISSLFGMNGVGSMSRTSRNSVISSGCLVFMSTALAVRCASVNVVLERRSLRRRSMSICAMPSCGSLQNLSDSNNMRPFSAMMAFPP